MFDELIVAVGNNPAKRYWFDLERRQQLLGECMGELPNVRVVQFSGLLVHAAQAHGAQVILRGLRTPSDFDLEFRNGLANRDMTGIETLFLLSEPGNLFVSSSLVKEIATYGGDVSNYVPPAVLSAIHERLNG